MTWFVLVPGACHGGWWFEPLASQLRQAGHTADPVTLTGLDPHGPAAPAANLDTHIGDVLGLLTRGNEHAVLVGHSYAGSVITGVADQRSTQITALLYLDAFVPRDGDSCWSMTNDEQRQWYGQGSGSTGLAVEPLPFFDDRAMPHPLGTLMQQSTLTGDYQTVRRKHYLAATGWAEHSPFTPLAQRLRLDPDWIVTDLDCGHDIVGNAPDELLKQVLELA